MPPKKDKALPQTQKRISTPPTSTPTTSTPTRASTPPTANGGGLVVLRKRDDGPAKPEAPAANGGIALIRKARSEADVKVIAEPKVTLREFPEDEVRDTARMWTHLTAGASTGERQGAAVAVAGLVKKEGILYLSTSKVLSEIEKGLQDQANPLVREGSLLLVEALSNSVGKPAEPYLVPLLGQILTLHADKWQGVRQAAEQAANAIIKSLTPPAVKILLPILFEALDKAKYWQGQEAAMKLLTSLAQTHAEQIRNCLPEIVPRVSEHVVDGKTQVMDAAYAAMQKAASTVNNRDISPVVPELVSCIARPNEVPQTVYKLSGLTFIQDVTSPTLSVLVPLLVRGLRERATLDKRRAVVVIENMSKLVKDAIDAAPFIPQLLPGLEKVSNEVADPEVRATAGKAHKALSNIADEAKQRMEELAKSPHVTDFAALQTILKELLSSAMPAESAGLAPKMLEYVTTLCRNLVLKDVFDFQTWVPCFVPFVAPFLPRQSVEEAEAICRALMSKAEGSETDEESDEDDDDEQGEDLCNCRFSLGYGSKILLSSARLHLKRGHRYGLCGHNGCGKSTLMRSIAKGMLDGFPSPDEVRTVYVEHDLDDSVSEQTVVEYLSSDPLLKGVTRDEILSVLSSMGFNEDYQKRAVGSLSGGYKMKLALVHSMLAKADILLLDEPTNHLDVVNVKWLEDYLNSLKGVSSIIVSHDSGFLDNVCTDIIHYERRKLIRYKGNLSKFVERKPEAKVYYDLNIARMKITFPAPGQLDGITRREQPILKLKEVEFQYDGSERAQLKDVNVQCTMASRVLIRGPNGAGKTTLVKVLTGQLRPQKGLVWKHPNLGIAYVAQHAFHHVEQHLEMSPCEYILWRYERGEDKEELNKVTRKITKEEQTKMEKMVMIRGEKRSIQKLLGRRKYKKTFEYEVKWVGLDPVHNAWMTRAMLEEMGFTKAMNEIDAQMVAKLGLYSRPLSITGVQAHLSDFGLDPEFGTYGQIKNLSGGQKVRVVLAAAMWANPHMVVMDEPTNYLDRDALGALAQATKEYQGAVVIISHNGEFARTVCTEEWTVSNGQVIAEGNAAYEAAKRRAAKGGPKTEE